MEDVELFIHSECPVCGEIGINPAWPQSDNVFITACVECDAVTVVDTGNRTLTQLVWGMVMSVTDFYKDLLAFAHLLFRNIVGKAMRRG